MRGPRADPGISGILQNLKTKTVAAPAPQQS
jgi:hypothetical protein